MDALAAEMAKKKTSLSSASRSKKRKFITQKELRKAESAASGDDAAEELRAARKKEKKEKEAALAAQSAKLVAAKEPTPQDTPAEVSSATLLATEAAVSALKMSTNSPLPKIIAFFRSFALPINLFGESLDALYLRYVLATTKASAAAIANAGDSEFNLGSDAKGRNVFVDGEAEEDFTKEYEIGGEEIYDEEFRQGEASKHKEKEAKKAAMMAEESDDDEEPSEDMHKNVHGFFKSQMRHWEKQLASRSEEVRRTAQGKTDLNTCKQSREYLRPLFKMLKDRSIESGQLYNINEIVKFCRAGEFVRANDSYIDIAIGRACWPMGVTQVGIHSRGGREKIGENKTAHVMNSEKQRKYLTSVKRLMNFYQETRDDVAPSKKVK